METGYRLRVCLGGFAPLALSRLLPVSKSKSQLSYPQLGLTTVPGSQGWEGHMTKYSRKVVHFWWWVQHAVFFRTSGAIFSLVARASVYPAVQKVPHLLSGCHQCLQVNRPPNGAPIPNLPCPRLLFQQMVLYHPPRK